MKQYTRTISFWLLLAFVVLNLLQFFPLTGIFLMFVGASMLSGMLLLILMGAVFFEALIGKLPIYFVLIPILALCGYYVVYFNQGRDISVREAELRQSNPTLVMPFNPEEQDLVMKYAGNFVNSHNIPVVYEENNNYPKEEHLSFRVVLKEQCQAIQEDSQGRLHKSAVSYRNNQGRRQVSKTLCLLRYPEKPRKKIVIVTIKEQEVWKHKPTIEEGIYTLMVDGQSLAEYKTASVYRYNFLPFPVIGCALNSGAPSWDCFASFRKTRYVLDTKPGALDSRRQQHPAAIMLGIKELSIKELEESRGYSSNALSILRARGENIKVTEGMYEKLDLVLSDDESKIPWRMVHTLSQRPDMLATRAELIIRYLEKTIGELKGIGSPINNLPGKRRALLRVLAWLPEPQLKQFGSRIVRLVKAYEKPRDIPEIYMRIADTGIDLESMYVVDKETRQARGWQAYLPVAGLCRLDKLKGKTVDQLKASFHAESANKKMNNALHETLFLALLKHDQRNFLEEKMGHLRLRHKGWYTRLLNGEGSTLIGPNNCMHRDGKVNSWLPKALGRFVAK